jgi:hypothetical protein
MRSGCLPGGGQLPFTSGKFNEYKRLNFQPDRYMSTWKLRCTSKLLEPFITATPERGCVEDQPQQLVFDEKSDLQLKTCCDWCSAHSRDPTTSGCSVRFLVHNRDILSLKTGRPPAPSQF